jgi:hypothetical protein
MDDMQDDIVDYSRTIIATVLIAVPPGDSSSKVSKTLSDKLKELYPMEIARINGQLTNMPLHLAVLTMNTHPIEVIGIDD